MKNSALSTTTKQALHAALNKFAAGGASLRTLRTARLCWGILFVAGPFTAPAIADPPVPEKVKIAVLGEVTKKAVYLLNPPATIESAFKAAGGWNGKGGLSREGGTPATYCILDTKNKEGGRLNIKITIKVDLVHKTVEVTDPAWKNQPLPQGACVTLPEMIF